MTTEQQHEIPKQPFPSCLSIDETLARLKRALGTLDHAMECREVSDARDRIEEAIEDVNGYREIHSNMRAWGQGWKDAFLSAVVEAKGRVELERVLKECRAEAAELKSSAAMYPDTDWGKMKRLTERAEAVGILFAVSKLSALCAEPRPQSGEEEVEEMRGCNRPELCILEQDVPTNTLCPICPDRGKRMERSGLHNAGSETRPHDINPT
jgi:hypothetical protein